MPSSTLQSEHRKLLNRREELLKQDVSLRKDYSILLRKIASVCQVLEQLDEGTDSTIYEYRAADYEKFGAWESLVPLLKTIEDIEARPLDEIEIPERLRESYELFKLTPLLYKDIGDS